MAASTPNRYEYKQLPILGLLEWDRVGEVRSVIRSLEAGQFNQAALLSELMGRDDRVDGCLSTRILGLTGSPLSFEPATIRGRVTNKTQRIANECEESWEQMLPGSAVGDLLKWGLLTGIGVGELPWSTDGDRWAPRLKVWHPQFLWWDWSVRRFRLIVQGAESPDGEAVPVESTVITLPDTSREIHSDGRWVIYCPRGYHYSWLKGLVRPLAQPWLIRGWAYRDWARNSEINGVPITKVSVPSEANEQVKERFTRLIANRGSESIIECPQLEGGMGYDVELVEATASNEDVFGGLISKAEASIGNIILGQSIAGEKPASIGNGTQNQDENVRHDLRRADARIVDTLRDQVLYHWAEYNFGDGELAPHVTYEVEPPEDESKRATVYQSLAGAVQTFASLPNSPVDIEALLEQAGIPLLPVEEQTEAPEPSDGGQGEEPAPTGLAALSDRPRRLRAASRRYPDRLALKSQIRATKALKPDLARLNAIIGEATSFADLKARLGTLAEDMDPTELAKLTEKSLILAELAGRHDVLTDL